MKTLQKTKRSFFPPKIPHDISTTNTRSPRKKNVSVLFVKFDQDFGPNIIYLSGDLAEPGEAAESSAFFFLEPRLLFNLLKESLSDFARVRFR